MFRWSAHGRCDDRENGRGDEDELESDLHGDIEDLSKRVSTVDVVEIVNATDKRGTRPIEVEELKS